MADRQRGHPTVARGAFVTEYAIVVAILAAALLAMTLVVKRGLSGRWRSVADTFGHGRQYEPGRTVGAQ